MISSLSDENTKLIIPNMILLIFNCWDDIPIEQQGSKGCLLTFHFWTYQENYYYDYEYVVIKLLNCMIVSMSHCVTAWLPPVTENCVKTGLASKENISKCGAAGCAETPPSVINLSSNFRWPDWRPVWWSTQEILTSHLPAPPPLHSGSGLTSPHSQPLILSLQISDAQIQSLRQKRQQPSNMPQITGLDVTCEKTGMVVSLQFSAPFNGVVFSKGHFSNPACR